MIVEKKHSQNPLLPILRKGNSKDLCKILWHESSQHRRVSTGSSEYTWGNKSQIWPWTKSPALLSFIGLSLSFICIRKFWLNKYFHIWKTAFCNILFPFVWVWWLCVLYVASIYEESRGRLQVSFSAYKKGIDYEILINMPMCFVLMCFPSFFVLFCGSFSLGQTKLCMPISMLCTFYYNLLPSPKTHPT